MDLKLNNRKALITGASYGLGYACAEILCEEGADVTIVSRDQARLETAQSELFSKNKGKVDSYKCNLSNSDDLEKLQALIKKENSYDILVVSTGHPPTFPFSQADDQQWQTGIDLILKPAIALARAALDGMKEKNYGRIIFIGSIFGMEAEKSSVIQSTLRTGLNALSKCIATEFAEYGITSNVICPGYFNTPLVENLAQQYANKDNKSLSDVLEDWKSFAPSKKYGKPRDLGSLVSFLASPLAEFINGTSIVIDGGALKQY